MPSVLLPCSETELLGKEYLHSIGDDLFARLMMHNTRLRKGCLYTGDLLSDIHPGEIISPYTTFTSEQRKEDAWESVRNLEFLSLPSRREALFLFENEADLQKASSKWWSGQSRRALRARIVRGSLAHKADSRLLDCYEGEWEENARRYWRGLQTDEPIFEIVVQGVVYLPGWESFPDLGI
jgi:hypothetical protein